MTYALPPRPEFYVPDAFACTPEEASASQPRNVTPAAVLAKAKVKLSKARARAATAAVNKARKLGTGRIRKATSRQKRRERHHSLSQIKHRITGVSRITRGSLRRLRRQHDNINDSLSCPTNNTREEEDAFNYGPEKSLHTSDLGGASTRAN